MNCSSVTAFSAPLLTTVTGIFAVSFALLTSISFPSLQYFGSLFNVSSSPNLTSATFSAAVYYASNISMSTGNGSLATVTLGTIGTLKAVIGATINISGQALTSASVNAILALLVSLNGTNGTIAWGAGQTLNISGGTSAAPSGQGITDKATLVGRGATVTTN